MKPIPAFPAFRPVCLEDRDFFESIFLKMQPEVSELNFTNLFMFRHVHDYRVSVLNGNVAILAKSYTGQPYFMPPIGDKKIPETMDALMDYMKKCDERPAMELAWRGFIDKYVEGNGKYRYGPDPDSFDYVYNTQDLIRLSGRKFHDKKNLLNRFLRSYKVHGYARLTKELLPQAKDLVLRWCQEKCALDIPSTFGETEATIRALDNLGELGIVAGVALVDGTVEALSLGEELNKDTVVIHVEKANSEYAGLYQYISSEYLRQEFPDHPFVNREQDLGEPNLRKSKLSYNPIRMIEKYKVWPRE
jgi:hypothetical protein